MKNVKRFKRLLAITLSAAMLLSVAGCGQKTENTGKEESKQESTTSESTAASESTVKEESKVEEKKDPVTLEWWYRGNGIQKDTEVVEEAMNELVKTYPGLEHVSINLNCYTSAEYRDAVVRAQSAGQQMDIVNTVGLNFANEINNGTFLAMNDLLEEHTALKDVLPQWLWDLGSANGNVYIVPNYQRAANQMYFITPTEYLNGYEGAEELRAVIADPEARTPEAVAAVLEDYLLSVREATGLDTKYLAPLGFYWRSAFSFAERFDTLTGCYIKMEGSKEVVHHQLTDDFKKACEISADWFDAGYIHPDQMTIDDTTLKGANMLNDVSYIYMINNQAGSEEEVSALYSTTYGIDVTCIPLFDNYYIGSSWGAGGNGISAKSAHPEEAARFLEVINTEEGKDLYNMVVYGLEGTHYEKIDDKTIKTLEYDSSQAGVDASYGAMKWIMGNTANAYLNQGCAANENELAVQINSDPNNAVSDIPAIFIDTTNIATQLEQTQAVYKEYGGALCFGVKGADEWEAYYNEFVEKLEAAGYKEAIAELQAQVDAYYAAK